MDTNYYFSPTKNAFYPAAWKAIYAASGTWPSDAMAIADAVFAEYGIGQPPAGQIRGVGANGMPAWIAAPTVQVPLNNQAQQALAQAQQTVWAEYGALGQSVPAAWITYQTALRNIISGVDTTSTTLPTAPAAYTD
ncbi:hypothetical protein AA13595_1306 [Gluconacetobacter johannae DSM 13595]|uniref:Uncharacterized protein n=1 Tax=Gluconacetobacter johannae TaxID=112140 RepID=A0A7W4P415_9PROT|nr:hypothetical protein [Gluconacetobacter johannae]MBB2176786.1 hypothetical protein [Gluconacetobacter johannae]GBQ84034.1 hypothetical protein AA13595_1306 [Gluconacetobacter johannae DSM 13595]